MGAAQIHILNVEEIAAVDEATRVLLYHTGVEVQSSAARRLLERSGAQVSTGSSRVLFSRAMIDRALANAPRSVVLASRDGKRDLRIPDGRTHITTDGCGVNIWDLETGTRRASTTADLAALSRVGDALDAVDVQWPMVVAGDVPTEIHGMTEAATTLEHTTKHVQHETLSTEQAEAYVRMASAVVGGPEALRAHPVVSSIQCSVSPLILEAGSTEGLVVLARAGVPVVPMSMVLLGGSSPVDLASGIVVANAENLASLCVAQAAASGAPVVYSVSSGPIDMRSGSLGSGSPEFALLNAAGVEMGRHYGLPTLVGGFATDADSPGLQAGAEKIGTGMFSLLAGADLISGIGSVDTSNTLSLEQLVLDSELVEYVRRSRGPIRVDADTIHLDLLSRLGPGGNYLKELHTLRNFREALWSPEILQRDGFVDGQPSEARVRSRAQAKARELLAKHTPAPLDPDVRRAVWAAVPKA